MRRSAIPFHSKRQAALVDVLDPKENLVDPHKGITTHLLLGTGIRNDTCGHTHETWFTYIEGELYLQVPSRESCRKKANEGNDSCGECDEGSYYPKTPAGSGRRIQVPNQYYNYHTGQEEYFGLRDRVEAYFGLSDSSAPDHAQHGFDMIQADGRDGVSVTTVNTYVRAVCAKAEINVQRRESRLEKELSPSGDKKAQDVIDNFGTDSEGNPIPDVIAHDLRASFCTQMCRTKNDSKNPDLMHIKQKSGHSNTATLEKYVSFANDEVDVEKEKNMF